MTQSGERTQFTFLVLCLPEMLRNRQMAFPLHHLKPLRIHKVQKTKVQTYPRSLVFEKSLGSSPSTSYNLKKGEHWNEVENEYFFFNSITFKIGTAVPLMIYSWIFWLTRLQFFVFHLDTPLTENSILLAVGIWKLTTAVVTNEKQNQVCVEQLNYMQAENIWGLNWTWKNSKISESVQTV